MKKLMVVSVLCLAVLVALRREVSAAVTVGSPDVTGWFDSLQQAQNLNDGGSTSSLWTDDSSTIYYRVISTVAWETPMEFPVIAKMGVWEDDTNADDFVANGLGGWQSNPGDPSDPTGGSWEMDHDYISTSGVNLADACGSSGEPGWNWELEVRVTYNSGGSDIEIDPSGWEQNQQFVIP
jgi:hypothetical protein